MGCSFPPGVCMIDPREVLPYKRLMGTGFANMPNLAYFTSDVVVVVQMTH